MLSIDTETTGLYFTHGCTTFAVGTYDGNKFGMVNRSIDPVTRRRRIEFGKTNRQDIRDKFFSADIVCIHNSLFDIRALVEAGVFDKDEPTVPEFWSKIVDTTILSHLHHNTDERSLKKLTPQYLDVPYESEDKLNTLVNKCRLFVRSRRPKWRLANKDTPELKPSGSNPKWWKADMWLPAAVAEDFTTKELEDYGIDSDSAQYLLADYLQDDCINTYNLAQSLLQAVIEDNGDDTVKYLEVNNQLLHVIYKMELRGTNIHKKELDDAIGVCESWINKLTKDTEELSGVENITDTKLRKILFDDMGLPIEKETKGGAASVDADTIIKLKRQFANKDYSDPAAEEFLTKIMALKKYSKKHGYLINFRNSKINNRVHTSYNIVGTDTLRVSAKNPPLQTVSKATNPFEDDNFEDINTILEQSPPLRSVFGPEKDRWWLCNDYSQLQLRIFAVVTDEQDMIRAFANGWDAHDYTARRIFGLKDTEKPSKRQRTIAKAVNFGFIFGSSPRKIELTSGISGLWDTICAMFPNAHDFIQYQKELLKSGNPVRTLGGYPLDVPMKEVKWKGGPERAAHAAVCYIVQGSEGEIVKRALRQCDDYLVENYPLGYPVLQVHDELDFDMPARFPKKHGLRLKEIMEEAALHYGVVAPVECEITTRRWNECRKVNLCQIS
jgi:DNA polymerase I-like protein with 3'-5' exonuclease and polymerase domains